jgi:hypothetical protein
MSENHHDNSEFDGGVFNDNRNKFPFEELAKYAGKRVAWSQDGTQILASGADYDELFRSLAAAGIKVNTVVLSYVPSAEEHTWL